MSWISLQYQKACDIQPGFEVNTDNMQGLSLLKHNARRMRRSSWFEHMAETRQSKQPFRLYCFTS